ncbi:related to STE6 - ABC transporter [Melanopsichium pennsylvanicum]|uniref:Related to STE6 - ABC transporter n=2 Tax=Melanopsichium pennsylvanicum TaxID=63383 RepID=A0AAJ4XKM3_9BASI|nr:related to STE6-ABC transporter [Melanopsichium pennsylvanicum 4]SNX84037.1 related to STE6 - ABC transporter [Melanopsichium pennsylvanicum]
MSKENLSKRASAPFKPSRTKPAIKLIFSFLTARDVVLLLMPALLCSITAGMIPMGMSKVVGKAFDAFTTFNLSSAPPHTIPSTVNNHFLQKIVSSVYLLLALAAATFFISTVSVSAWICLGERTAARVRCVVFSSVMSKKMAWYDAGMGLTQNSNREDHDGDAVEISPAGLMTKVARECDDIRVAISRETGDVVQHITTAVANLVLALATSWSLTLVILASVPAVLVMTIVTEIGAAPWLQRERISTSQATSMVERVVDAINTVKAFNAQKRENNRMQEELKSGCKSYRRMLLWWAVRFGFTSALVFATFVQGFWFGSHLISKGKISPGEVMTVFMSSLLVTSTINEIVQALSYIDKGKIGAANLIDLINSSNSTHSSHKNLQDSHSSSSVRSSDYSDDKTPLSACLSSPTSPASDSDLAPASMLESLEYDLRRAKAIPMSIEDIPTTPSPGITSPDKFTYRATPMPHSSRATKRSVVGLRRIAPATCQGEVHLRGVTFSYPSRPDARVLNNVDLYFPPAEMTYVVGGSGSGKSTIAHLLLRLYEPTAGTIQIDDQTIEYLDPHWCRQHIGAVSQDPIIFDMNVHDNVALGLVGKQDPSTGSASDTGVPKVSRESIESACRLALLHEFVRDLPDAYETVLGAKGTALSGGQRQRLAIARVRLRDPSILILDEATSALDPTTRHLVHEAIKSWRRGKTTIIITHDLSQIQHEDFLYLLENGHVVQQGYRSDLEAKDGPFRNMSMHQQSQGDDDPKHSHHQAAEEEDDLNYTSKNAEIHDEPYARRRRLKHKSLLGWEREGGLLPEHLSLIISQKLENAPSHLKPLRLAERQAMNTYYEDAEALKATGSTASNRRAGNVAVERKRWDTAPEQNNTNDVGLRKTSQVAVEEVSDASQSVRPTTRQVWSIMWRTIPNRAVLIAGILLCVMAGSLTPIFSYLLAQLLSTMGRPDQSDLVLKWSLLILLVALLEGIFAFSRYLLMEYLADEWLYRLRSCSYRNVIAQDRTWFDQPNNSAALICQSIVKDGDDARNFVGQIIGQLGLITSMVTLGIVWAMVVGWKLTLVGVAFGPVFLAATFLQSRVIGSYEARNKLKREAVSESFHSMVSHIRSIRSMGLEMVFDLTYRLAVADAQRCGMRASIFSGFGHGMSEALTYIAEALIFYVGAKLMISGEYDLKRMMQVFNLIIFAVTFAAHMLTFLPGLSKSMKALYDLDRLLKLSDPSVVRNEANGQLTGDIKGAIEFKNVDFSYDGRASVQVLKGVQLEVRQGECVAIVGGSGCGKSTIAALLQRLYEPSSGSILIDGTPISELSTSWLREHISVVGQNPSLFDMSIADNIAYGANSKIYEEAPVHIKQRDTEMAEAEMALVKQSARAANAHSFIESLPSGYNTIVGGGAGCKLSGGQAQRLAIARALMRVRAPILILDECTSALDVTNQQLIVETLLSPNAEVRKRRMTTLVITHNLEMMRKCDRILVLKEGRVAEQGSYNALVATAGGYFASLTRGGEWTG